MGKEKSAWRIIPRPLLETVLNNHAHHHRVAQPLFLHGPRGVGKSSLLHFRLLDDWNKAPHFTAYVDFASHHHPHQVPWTSFSAASPPVPLSVLRSQLESALESVVLHGIHLGSISGNDVFSALNKRHGIHAALRHIVSGQEEKNKKDKKVSLSALWTRAVTVVSRRGREGEIGDMVKNVCGRGEIEEVSYMREATVSMRLAKEVIGIHLEWRREAIRRLNQTGGFSRSLANSCTDWPCLLIELLSGAAETDHFQPKLVINNFDILRKAVLTDDTTVSASLYHDSFIWRLVALGINDWCLPIILVTSDSYYSYQAFEDFGYPDIFISRETFGWTRQEAKMHMVPEFFNESEWKVIEEVLGPNQRQLNELYALKQSSGYQDGIEGGMKSMNHIEDLVDAYLAYLQVNFVDPAMESVLATLQKFVSDAKDGKVPEKHLHFGAPWRHPPCTGAPESSLRWAKIQLMDYVQSLINTEFGVNYLADDSLEIFKDPCTYPMLEVGLLYAQRDPSFIRPVSRGIMRCLVRWLVNQRMQMNVWEAFPYLWQRFMRGRSYRHLMKEIGYK